MNLPHKCLIRLIQEIFLEENICVPLKGVPRIECESLIQGHNQGVLGLLYERPLQREGGSLVEAVLNEFDRLELLLGLEMRELHCVAISVVVQRLVVEGERVVHVRVVNQTLRVVTLL